MFKTAKTPINLDAPEREQLSIHTIASNLSLFSHSAVGTITLAQLSVMAAGEIRARNYEPHVQMQALLHFAAAAYVPHPLVPILDGHLSQQIYALGGEACEKLNTALARKYGFPLTVPNIVFQAIEAELCADSTPATWPADLACWIFMLAAVLISHDVSDECRLTVLAEVREDVRQYAWLCMGPAGIANRASAPTHSRLAGSVNALSMDLQTVFRAHGFDPAGPEFAQLLEAMQELEKQNSANAPASGPPERNDKGLN